MASSKTAPYTALAANGGLATTKCVAAGATGSSALISEGTHSLVDTLNELLLLLGVSRSQKSPDAKRPFGYGREQCFCSYVVALLIFGVGAAFRSTKELRTCNTRNPSARTSSRWRNKRARRRRREQAVKRRLPARTRLAGKEARITPSSTRPVSAFLRTFASCAFPKKPSGKSSKPPTSWTWWAITCR